MKRLLLFLSLFLIPCASFAEKVSYEKALIVASNFCSVMPATKASSSLRLIAGGDEYFVFQRTGGGFVIVS
ncbi:MAG: hypothetical protein IJ636_05940, partial [Bacteroidales bacterium]|nr:hypothetical protein [Bacteroidales bacterium]